MPHLLPSFIPFRCVTLVLALLCQSAAFSQGAMAAEVYRWKDDKGVVHFTDQPTQNAERVTIKPTQTINLNLPATTDSASAPSDGSPAQTLGYSAVSITNPGQESAFHAPDGSVNVTFSASPALTNKDQYRLTLDGTTVYTGTGNSTTLQNVERGTHKLQVSVIDTMGSTRITSDTVSFTVHRPIANKNN